MVSLYYTAKHGKCHDTSAHIGAILKVSNCEICVTMQRVQLLLRIKLRLCVPEFVIFSTFIGNQHFMRPMLDDGTLVEHCNLVAEFTRRETMGDIEYGLKAARRAPQFSKR